VSNRKVENRTTAGIVVSRSTAPLAHAATVRLVVCLGAGGAWPEHAGGHTDRLECCCIAGSARNNAWRSGTFVGVDLSRLRIVAPLSRCRVATVGAAWIDAGHGRAADGFSSVADTNDIAGMGTAAITAVASLLFLFTRIHPLLVLAMAAALVASGLLV